MINRRTRSHLSCQGSWVAVGDIVELPDVVVRVLTLIISRQSAACWRVFRSPLPNIRLNLDNSDGPGELGVTVNLAVLNKSKSIDDRRTIASKRFTEDLC